MSFGRVAPGRAAGGHRPVRARTRSSTSLTSPFSTPGTGCCWPPAPCPWAFRTAGRGSPSRCRPGRCVATKPSIAVIGTGKRTGKTAVAAELARSPDRRPAASRSSWPWGGAGRPSRRSSTRPPSTSHPKRCWLWPAPAATPPATTWRTPSPPASSPSGPAAAAAAWPGEPASATFAAGVELANQRPEELLDSGGLGHQHPARPRRRHDLRGWRLRRPLTRSFFWAIWALTLCCWPIWS